MRVSAVWAETQLPGLEEHAWGQPKPLLYSHHCPVTTIIPYNANLQHFHNSTIYFKVPKYWLFVNHTNLTYIMYNILLNSGRMFIVFRRRVFCFSDPGPSRDPSGLLQGCDLDNETLTAVSKTIFPPIYTCCCFWAQQEQAFVNLRRSIHRWTRLITRHSQPSAKPYFLS